MTDTLDRYQRFMRGMQPAREQATVPDGTPAPEEWEPVVEYLRKPRLRSEVLAWADERAIATEAIAAALVWLLAQGRVVKLRSRTMAGRPVIRYAAR